MAINGRSHFISDMVQALTELKVGVEITIADSGHFLRILHYHSTIRVSPDTPYPLNVGVI